MNKKSLKIVEIKLQLNNLSQLYPASTSKEGSSLLSNYLLSIVPAKLFCNLSRHHPRRIDEEFKKADADYLDTVLSESLHNPNNDKWG